MLRKVCNFSLKLEIKSVTCPGVWLCLNGYVSLIVTALETEYETKYVKPVFPLIFHEVFYFKKIIDGANNLTNLRKMLRSEIFTCLLVQWPSNCHCEQGKVLSKFHSSLDQLIYPASDSLNNNLELLMEPSAIFPGILSPKIEMFTMIKVVEILEPFVKPPDNLQKHIKHVNLNFTRKLSIKQNAVCHSQNYHRKYYENQKYLKKALIENNKIGNNFRFQKKKIDDSLCSIDNKVLKIHQLANCGTCSEYYRIFENISLPLANCENETKDELTYEIYNKALSKNFDEDVPNSIHSRLAQIISDRSYCDCSASKFSFRNPYENLSREKLEFQNQVVPNCILKKFESMNIKCLCK